MKRKLWTVFGCLLAASTLYAQAGSGCKDDSVQTTTGAVAVSASVLVCPMASTGTPCTPIAALFSDDLLTNPIANPIAIGADGTYHFCAVSGVYRVQTTYGGVTTQKTNFAVSPVVNAASRWQLAAFVDDGLTTGIAGTFTTQRNVTLLRISVRTDTPWSGCATMGTLTLTGPAVAPSPAPVLAAITFNSPVYGAGGSVMSFVSSINKPLNVSLAQGMDIVATYSPAISCAQYPTAVRITFEYDGAR